MGYWTKTKAKYKIPDRPDHPWAELVRKTLETANPELKQNLEESGDLEAYVDVQLDDALRLIRDSMNSGQDYETAKELAFAELFPSDPPDIEDWEEEGGQQDAIDAFMDWIDDRDS